LGQNKSKLKNELSAKFVKLDLKYETVKIRFFGSWKKRRNSRKVWPV